MKKGDQSKDVRDSVLSKGNAIREQGTRLWATLEILTAHGANIEDAAFLREFASAASCLMALLKTLRVARSYEYGAIAEKILKALSWREKITLNLVVKLIDDSGIPWVKSSDVNGSIIIKVHPSDFRPYQVGISWGSMAKEDTDDPRLAKVIVIYENPAKGYSEVVFEGLVTSGELNIILRSPDKF